MKGVYHVWCHPWSSPPALPHSELAKHTAVYRIMKEHWKCRKTILFNSACSCLNLPTGSACIFCCCKLGQYKGQQLNIMYKIKTGKVTIEGSTHYFRKMHYLIKKLPKQLKEKKQKKNMEWHAVISNIHTWCLSVKWPVTNVDRHKSLAQVTTLLVCQHPFPNVVKGVC